MDAERMTYKTSEKRRKSSLIYHQKHRQKYREYAKRYYQKLKERRATDPELDKRLRDEANARCRKYYRHRSEEVRKRKLAYNLKWYHANKGRVNQSRKGYRQTKKYKDWSKKYHHEYYLREKERYRKNNRAWCAANPDKVRASRIREKETRRKRYKERYATDPAFYAHERERMRRFYQKCKERMETDKKYRACVMSKRRESGRKKHERQLALFALDADAYAVQRGKWRMRKAVRKVRQGKTYTPRPSWRIPDFQTKKNIVFDVNSSFIFDNITASQRGQILEWAVERKKAAKPR